MFKDVFVLKKSKWYIKACNYMMDYIWGWSHTDFTHMCPYFWLSILNVFIIPFVFVWRLIFWPIFKYLGKGIMAIIFEIDEYLSNQREKEFQRWEALFESDEEEFAKQFSVALIGMKLLHSDSEKHPVSRMYDYIYNLQFTGNDSERWRLFANRLIDMRDAEELRRKLIRKNIIDGSFSAPVDLDALKEYERQRMIARKNKIAKLSNLSKSIAKGLLWIIGATLAVFAVIGGYRLIKFIGNTTSKEWMKFFTKTGEFFLFLLIAAAIIATVAGIVILIVNSFKKKNKFATATGGIFIGLWTFIAFIGLKIWAFITFMVRMIKNDCPAIRWED